MARIAIVKLFNGLNLAPAQLAGQLLAAGHEVKIIYFKETLALPTAEAGDYLELDYPGTGFVANGEEYSVDLYRPVSESEEQLLVEELRDFNPDCIGFTVFSGMIGLCGEISDSLRKSFDIPIIWGGSGPTLEPEKCIDYADLLCINEGEAVIVELADRLDANAGFTDIEGTWCKDNTEVIRNPDRSLMALDDLAMPDWSLERYVYINEDKVERNY